MLLITVCAVLCAVAHSSTYYEKPDSLNIMVYKKSDFDFRSFIDYGKMLEGSYPAAILFSNEMNKGTLDPPRTTALCHQHEDQYLNLHVIHCGAYQVEICPAMEELTFDEIMDYFDYRNEAMTFAKSLLPNVHEIDRVEIKCGEGPTYTYSQEQVKEIAERQTHQG